MQSQRIALPGFEHVSRGHHYQSRVAGGTKVSLKAGFATVSCSKAETEVKTETTSTPKGPITKATFEESKDSLGRTCSWTGEKGGVLQVHPIAGTTNGNITTSGFTWKVVCGTGPLATTCVYSGTMSDKASLIGGAPATVEAKEAHVLWIRKR